MMSKIKYPDEFEQLWKIYPKRRPSNPKIKAFKAFTARLKQGYSYNDMKEGLIRYIACKEAENQIGTPFILQGGTFFGPDEWFLEDWEPPKKEIKETIEEKGKRLNILPRPGESMDEYNRRIQQAR